MEQLINNPQDVVKLSPEIINSVKVESMTNFSQVLGIATAVARKHIISYFNDGFFKHERIGTNLQSIGERFNKYNNDKQARKQNPAISMKIEYNPRDALRNDSAIPGNYYATGGVSGGTIGGNDFLFPLYNNDARDDLRYEMKRTTISFPVAIRVGTQLEAWNVGEFLGTKLRSNRNFYLRNQLVHVIIPDALIAQICKVNKLDWKDTDVILTHLRKFSENEINVINYGGTNSRKFTFGRLTDFQFEINNVPSISVNKKGKAEMNSTIGFSFDLHFSYPCAFVLNTMPVEFNNSVLDNIISDRLSSESGVIHLNVPGLSFAPREYINGKYRYAFVKFSPEVNKPVETIKFKECLSKQVLSYIQSLIDDGIDVNSIVDFYMFNGDISLNPKDFYIDWKTFQIILDSPVINEMYAFAIYIDRNKLYPTN